MLDYDRKRYPNIARAEKRDLKSGWTQAECDHVRERGLENLYSGTREERLQKDDDAIRISEENGISSAEWAKQKKTMQSEDSVPWSFIFIPVLLFVCIAACSYVDLHRTNSKQHVSTHHTVDTSKWFAD